MGFDDSKLVRDFITAPTNAKAIEAVLRPMVEGALRAEAERFGERPGLVYKGPADFVLKHGTWFTKVAELGPEYWFPRGYCYGAAINTGAMYGERYFEGFALFEYDGQQGITPHAWNVRASHPDLVIDRSWGDKPGFLYVGVEFSVERADDATWNGDACVLYDEQRGFPLFRQHWCGEPPDAVWPPSERLEFLRTRDKDRARAFVNVHKDLLP